MPSHYEAVLMSYLAYELNGETNWPRFKNKKITASYLPLVFETHIGSSTKHDCVNYLTQRAWEYYASYCCEVEGYQGVAFINSKTKEIVIAHRGTVFGMNLVSKSNYKDDIEIFKGKDGNIPSILSIAFNFITQVIRKRDGKHPNYTLWQTGHSLGGFLAECGNAYVANPSPHFPKWDQKIFGNDDSYFRLHNKRPQDANAITFDSLGGGNVLIKLGIPLGKANTINYLPKPNIANTANPHDGEKRLLMDEKHYEINTANESQVIINADVIVNLQEVFATLECHKLVNIMKAFNPKTGNPYEYKKVSSWPTAKNTFITSEQPKLPEIDPKADFLPSMIISTGFLAVHTMTKVTQFTHIRTGNLAYEGMEQSINIATTTTTPTPTNISLQNNPLTAYNLVNTKFNPRKNSKENTISTVHAYPRSQDKSQDFQPQ